MSISLHELRFAQHTPDKLPAEHWDELVTLNEAAVRHVYDERFRSHPDVRAAIGSEDIDAYVDRLKHPGANKPHQLYAHPRLTLATHKDTDDIIGWVYSANNTSGVEAVAKMEAYVPLKRWQWLGWIATHPDAMRSGVAEACVAVAIGQGQLLQPVSAYAWPGERVASSLVKNGLQPAGRAAMYPVSPADHLDTRRYILSASRQDVRRQVVERLRARLRMHSLDVEFN